MPHEDQLPARATVGWWTSPEDALTKISQISQIGMQKKKKDYLLLNLRHLRNPCPSLPLCILYPRSQPAAADRQLRGFVVKNNE
jgi:hypothetical protein